MSARDGELGRLAAIAVAALGLSGCLTFNGGELPQRDLPAPRSLRPLIGTKLGSIRVAVDGKDDPHPLFSATEYGAVTMMAVLSRWKSAQLIEDYAPTAELARVPDYELELSGAVEVEGSSPALLSAVTLFLFPDSSTLRYEWTFRLTNVRTHRAF